MSDLSNETPNVEESDNFEESSSPRTMLVTLALLIAGFLLSSTMMLYYASKKTGTGGKGTDFMIDVASLIKKGKINAEQLKNKIEKPKPSTQETLEDPEDKGIGKLFSDRAENVRWPKLTLTGFGSSTEGGFAIINGKQIHPGQQIDGKVTLSEVRSHDIVVEYKGETKTLTMNTRN